MKGKDSIPYTQWIQNFKSSAFCNAMAGWWGAGGNTFAAPLSQKMTFIGLLNKISLILNEQQRLMIFGQNFEIPTKVATAS